MTDNFTLFFDWTNILGHPFQDDIVRVNYGVNPNGTPIGTEVFPMVIRYEERIISGGIRFNFGGRSPRRRHRLTFPLPPRRLRRRRSSSPLRRLRRRQRCRSGANAGSADLGLAVLPEDRRDVEIAVVACLRQPLRRFPGVEADEAARADRKDALVPRPAQAAGLRS